MPAQSAAQAHTAGMAIAYKHGKPLTLFPAGARGAIQQMAQMADEDLQDFTRTRPKRTLLSRRDERG